MQTMIIGLYLIKNTIKAYRINMVELFVTSDISIQISSIDER